MLGIVQREVQDIAGPLDHDFGRGIRAGKFGRFRGHGATVHMEHERCQPMGGDFLEAGAIHPARCRNIWEALHMIVAGSEQTPGNSAPAKVQRGKLPGPRYAWRASAAPSVSQ